MKLLVVAPSWIGDTVMMQPLLSRLRERHADATIDVLASPWSASLIRRMPEVAAVVENPFRHGEFDFAGRRRLGHRLAAAGYDEAIVLPNSWKSALVPFFAGIPVRTGYHGEARYVLLTRRHRLDRERHPRLVDRYVQLAEKPGTAATVPLRPPHLRAEPERQRATRIALGLPTDTAPVVFCPGAEFGSAKRWPATHFASLARSLAERGHPVWLVGSEKDRMVGEEIARLADGAALSLCGRTSLDQAIDLIAGASRVVCNDSGLMHIAAALDRPLVAVFGSSSPGYTPPLSPSARIVSLGLDCSPCFKRECPLGHLRCLNDLAPARVLAALEE